MLISLLRYLQGYLKIRVTGYSPERFLNLCKNKKIAVWGLESAHNSYEMYIRISGFRKLKPILKKTRTKVSILERYGLPFFFHKYRKRKLFFASIFICIALIYAMTFFIWDIDLEGNQTITDDVLLEYLETKDVKHGMKKRKVDCEQIVKDIRKEFNDIIWVSVSLEGTRLFVHVKENTDTFDLSKEESAPCDIVAAKAGIVRSIITRRGVPMVSVGDEVEEGAVLVSGTIEVMNDAGEVASQHYVTSDADIILETIYSYEDILMKRYKNKVYTGRKRNIWTIRVGDYKLGFGIQKNSFVYSEEYAGEKQLRLEDHFYLPIHVGKKKIVEYEFETLEYTNTEMENLLREKFNRFCENLEKQGAVILENTLDITHGQTGAKATSLLMLQEEAVVRRKIVDF